MQPWIAVEAVMLTFSDTKLEVEDPSTIIMRRMKKNAIEMGVNPLGDYSPLTECFIFIK